MDHVTEKKMNKTLEKRGIGYGNRTKAGLSDYYGLGFTTSYKDENIQPTEISIGRLAEYIGQKEQLHNDGYWSVLGEL
jgi:hypothetical protein